MKCWNRKCRAEIRESDRRDRDVPSSADEPSHLDVNGGCTRCVESSDSEDRALNGYWEGRISEERGQ